MKRNEMVEKIAEMLVDGMCGSARNIASKILSMIEQQGMLPPFMDGVPLKDAEKGNYITLHVGNAAYAGICKWESKKDKIQ